MARKFDLLWRLLDVPSGAVLGVLSGSLIIMTWISFFAPRFKIPDGFIASYAVAVGGVTVNNIGTRRSAKNRRVIVDGEEKELD